MFHNFYPKAGNPRRGAGRGARRLIGLALGLLALAPWAGESRAVDHIVTTAYVNLLDGPNSQTSTAPDSAVSSSAHAGTADASCRADTHLNLSTSASSADMGLIFPSHSSAAYLAGFRDFVSDLDTYVPPGSSSKLHVTLNATSTPGDRGSLGQASFDYLLETATATRHTSVILQSQAGIPTLLVFGNALDGNIHARVTPTISLSGTIPLIKDDLTHLGVDYHAKITLDEFDTSVLEGIALGIAQALFEVGLPRLDLPPGTMVHVGFKVDFIFQLHTPVGLQPGIDALFVNIQSGAQTSPGASATCTFTHKLAR